MGAYYHGYGFFSPTKRYFIYEADDYPYFIDLNTKQVIKTRPRLSIRNLQFIDDNVIVNLLYNYLKIENGKVVLLIDKEPLEYYKEENGIYFLDLRDFLNKNIYPFLMDGYIKFHDEWEDYFDIYDEDNTKKDMEEYFCEEFISFKKIKFKN